MLICGTRVLRLFSALNSHGFYIRATCVSTKSNETLAKKNFSQLFKESSFVQLGDVAIESKLVKGIIAEVVGSDLYVDYGGKFYVVCRAPPGETFYRRDGVTIRLKDHELTSSFIGSDKHVTLLEADGIFHSAARLKKDISAGSVGPGEDSLVLKEGEDISVQTPESSFYEDFPYEELNSHMSDSLASDESPSIPNPKLDMST